ncbi:MAG: type 1 glutamine amidotransferase [Magnetovibrio sp.]|nr:type 1 glutamine amidotransferase [Magnetovibrio sp.]
MAAGLRFLIAEGNPAARNDVLLGLGGRPGSVCFTDALKTLQPDCAVEVVTPADGDPELPPGTTLADFDGVMMSGSGLNIPGGDDDPRVQRQIAFARAVFEAKVPFYGSCWGLQVAAAAAGGRVAASPRGSEMGFARKIALTREGRGHPLHTDRAGAFDAPAIHVDEVTHLPSGATVLAENAFCAIQSASITYRGGVFWGVQYHPEFDLADMARLIERYTDRLITQGFYADADAARRHCEQLTTLHQDPDRQDVAWLLGIDADILDPRIRWREIDNWIERLVRPRRARR